MPEEWLQCYEAGIWTEFMEQRAPGHTAGGERIFQKGILDIKEEIKQRMAQLDKSDSAYEEKLEELKAMDIAADALLIYAQRYAEKLEQLAQEETNVDRKAELLHMASICRKVPAHAPETFWEALQHYWFIHVGITYETNPWDSFNPGRLDQHLRPFYEKEISEGTLTREKAKELLEAFWVKFNNQPAVPKVGVTAEESFTYNDFTKINIGGLKVDGSDGTSDVSYLLLEVLDEMRTLQPNTAVLISNKTPDRLLRKALEVIGPGFGEPPLFNADGIIVKMLRQGKTLKGMQGCRGKRAVWRQVPLAKESYILTGYFNLPRILEITLNNGVDPITGRKIGLETGDPTTFQTYEELWDAYLKQIKYFMDIKMKGNDIIEELYATELPVPFMSLWIEDCVKRAKDYNSGGARYNTQYVQLVGLGTVTLSLSSIKYHVFENHTFSMEELLKALSSNFEGPYEMMRQVILTRTPKFGEDNDFADNIAKALVDKTVELIESYPPTPVRRASRRAYWLPTTVHVYFGRVSGSQS